MKRVVHISTVHQPFDIRIFHKECVSLAKAGYEVYNIGRFKKEEIVNGVRIVPVRSFAKKIWRLIFGPLMAMSQLKNIRNVQLVHLHDPELLLIAPLLKLFGFTVVFDMHEDVRAQIKGKQWIPKSLRTLISFVYGFSERFLLWFVDAVITVSEPIIDKVRHPRKLLLRNLPLKSEFQTELGQKNAKSDLVKLVYTGDLTEIRGATQMLNLLEDLSTDWEVELHFAGRIPDRGFEKRLRSHPAFSKMIQHGWLNRPQMIDLLTSSSLGLCLLHKMPNHEVSWPIKIFEYMGAGIPQLTSDYAHWKHVVEGNGCGICVDVNRRKEVHDAARHILGSTERVREMGANARAAILDGKLNWESESLALTSLYREV